MRSPLAEARNDNAAPRNGEVVAGRYRVEGVIGSGGMGRVVAARDASGQAVAIKLLLSPPSERVWVERFFREARAVSRISSHHVVKVLAVSSPNESTPFIVMERLRGRDFGKRLRAEGPLTLREVSDCIIQACDALAHSHAVGIVHRDVKPSNLFDHANADGSHTIKVLDFGISKARGPDEFEHTLTTSRDGMLGSPPYMSPEHIRDARSVDHRTDIWSLGVVAYQLLAGRLPFDGQSVGEVFCSVLERRFTALSSVRPDLPREIEAIIGRCLSREPSDRFQTAADLARAFIPYASASSAALVDHMPTAIPPPAANSGSIVTRASSPSGARMDAEVHTLTLPPTMPLGVGEELQAASERFVTMPTLQGQSAPPLAMLELGATLQPLSEPLSAASVEAAKRMKNASRRSMFLAAGVGAVLLMLAAIPFAMSHESKPVADPREAPIVPATAVTPVATAIANAGPTGTAVPNTPVTVATPTPAPQADDIQILSTGKVPGGSSSSRTNGVRPPPRTQKTGGAAKPKETTHVAAQQQTAATPETATPPPAPPPPPAPKPESRPELHPNPYGSF